MDSLIERNNTSFPKQLYETIKKMEIDKDDPLRYHQRIAVDYLLKYNVRGILAYHKMGSGKTIVAVSTSIKLNMLGKKIIFIASKSLHNNFKADVRKYYTLDSEFASKYPDINEYIDNINMVSMNASNMIKQVKKAIGDDIVDITKEIRSLEDTFIIIDEAHNFFNSISNESKNALKLYNLIMNTRNIKLLFLTGSPIVNHPFELSLCYNMLAGKVENKTIFSEDYGNFGSMYIANYENEMIDGKKEKVYKTPKIANSDKFSDRIFGLTSYFGADTKDQEGLFPEKYPLIRVKVNMSNEQYLMYAIAREQEIKESQQSSGVRASKKFGKPEGASSSYRVQSRQFSNVVFPQEAIDLHRDKGRIKINRYLNKITDEQIRYQLDTLSPKVKKMLMNISLHTPEKVLADIRPKNINKIMEFRKKNHPNWILGIGKGLVYSQFLDSGVKFVGRCMEVFGMQNISDHSDLMKYMKQPDNLKNGSFAIISGEMDVDDRAKIIEAYNSGENNTGEIITMLLITSTGAEGLDLKAGRHGHIMEPYWNYSRVDQVIARLVRAGSHLMLDEKDRNVQYYIYMSDYPKQSDEDAIDLKRVEFTTDITLLFNALQNQQLIMSFLEMVKASSIDCMIHYKDRDDVVCRLCAPTGKVLWYPGQKGLGLSSPCEPLKEKKIKAYEIIVDGDKYMYSIIDDIIHIFEYQSDIESYKEIFSDHVRYSDIHEAIEKVV